MDKYAYKIVETKEDPMDNVIEKSNVTVKFSMREVASEDRQMQKMIIELEGKLKYEEAKKTNIENNHPFVKELTDEQRFTVHMYEESCAYVRAITPKLEELKKGLIESREEVAEINKQVGIAIPASALDIRPGMPGGQGTANVEIKKDEETKTDQEKAA